MTLYVAQEDLYFQKILKYFDREYDYNAASMLDAWAFFQPLDEKIEKLFQILSPYVVFEYLANTPKSRKNTLKFYQINKSKIDEMKSHNDYNDRKSWNDIQLEHSIFPLDEQKMIRDVLIYCSLNDQSQHVQTFVIQNFAHIATMVKIEADLKSLTTKYNIQNLDVHKLPDFEDRVRITQFKEKSFPSLLIKSDALTPTAYNKWFTYVFVKTYLPKLAERLPKNLVLTDSDLVPQLMSYAGAKFANSPTINKIFEYDDVIIEQYNDGIKIKPNQIIIGSETYHVKTNSTLNDILDIVMNDQNQKLLKFTKKALHSNIIDHLKLGHTKVHHLSDQTNNQLDNVSSKYTLTANAQSLLLHLLNKHPLLSEIMNVPLSKDDLLKINKSMIIYNNITSDFIERQSKNIDLVKFNTAYVQLIMTICLTVLTKIESQKIITETKEIIKVDKSLDSKVKNLESQLQDKNNQILQLSKDANRVDSLELQLKDAKSQIQQLEKELDTSKQIVVQPIYHQQPVDLTQLESRLNNTDVTFVGGHQSWQANTKVWAPKATYIHPDEAARQIPKTTKILIINTGYLNHGMYYHTKNAYDNLKDCQLVYLNSQSTNKNIILTELSKQVKLEN